MGYSEGEKAGRIAALREAGHAICEEYVLGMTADQVRNRYMEIIDALIADRKSVV